MAASYGEECRPMFTSEDECIRFMTAGGGCTEAYEAFRECVAAAWEEGSDDAERCLEAALNLKKCMEEHADYYSSKDGEEEADFFFF